VAGDRIDRRRGTDPKRAISQELDGLELLDPCKRHQPAVVLQPRLEVDQDVGATGKDCAALGVLGEQGAGLAHARRLDEVEVAHGH